MVLATKLWDVSLSGARPSADLGGSSKYTNVIFVD